MPSYETLLAELVQPSVLRVTLNRPAAANALNTRMAEELLAVWSGLAADPGEVRAVVLTGAGERAFCAGADLKERRGMSDAQWQAQHLIFERQYGALLEVPVPVIAAVNGHAYAGGLELMLACDFAYAAAGARFALTEVTLGIMPGAGGTQFLPRAVGERRAKEIILTGRPFSAEDAAQWGLVNRVMPRESLLDEALAAAGAIAENAPLSVRQAKKAIHAGLQLDLRNALLFEIEAYNRLVPTEDRREGILAFNEKRKPRFQGR
jgi:enoyl-CoA hydratase